MTVEKPFDFLSRCRKIHRPYRIDPSRVLPERETAVTDEWVIVRAPDIGTTAALAAEDLADYFRVSMRLSVPVADAEPADGRRILLRRDPAVGERGFRVTVETDRVDVIGYDDRMIAQGCYVLEDEMNRHGYPSLERQDTVRHIRFSPRMAMPIDTSDEALSVLAHYGIDTVLVSSDGVLTNPEKAAELNDLVKRAARYGLDTYTFSPFHWNRKHPQDEGARAYYEERFGALFAVCPNLKGFLFIGETCEFPSHDARTTMKSVYESAGCDKPSPGWFPCRDYPEFIGLIADIIHSRRADADIVFWTYNWGHAPAEDRVYLVEHLPRTVTVMTTFEVPDTLTVAPGITEEPNDYTLWMVGPSPCFREESAAAGRAGLRMYTMLNGAGGTWDFGCVPYIPAVDRWMERHRAAVAAQEQLQLDGLHECHSYGFTGWLGSELEKYAYYLPQPDMETLYRQLLVRDFGENFADTAREVFRLYSDAMKYCVCTANDQYGPARVGPVYPLFFKTEEPLPAGSPSDPRNPNNTCSASYYYSLDDADRLLFEADSYEKTARLFHAGNELLAGVITALSGEKRASAELLLGVARYIEYSAVTVFHVKRWHYIKGTLGILQEHHCIFEGYPGCPGSKPTTKMPDPATDRAAALAELIRIAEEELDNARRTVPLVERDSRLGYTPELGYCASPAQLQWKISVTERTLRELYEALADEAKPRPTVG